MHEVHNYNGNACQNQNKQYVCMYVCMYVLYSVYVIYQA